MSTMKSSIYPFLMLLFLFSSPTNGFEKRRVFEGTRSVETSPKYWKSSSRTRQLSSLSSSSSNMYESKDLSARGGGVLHDVQKESSDDSIRKPLTILNTSSFLLSVSSALIAFTPVPALMGMGIKSEKIASITSTVTAVAALCEIFLSPLIGKVLDSTGRKPSLIYVVSAITLSTGIAFVNPSVITLCLCRFISLLFGSLSMLIRQTITSDLVASDPERMGFETGIQFALGSGGFLVGVVGGGMLSRYGVTLLYGISLVLKLVTTLALLTLLPETLVPSKRIPFEAEAIKRAFIRAPLSCTDILFRHGRKVRVLAIVLMLQSFPMSCGDVFQLYARSEWKLSTGGFSGLVGTAMIMGVFGNACSSILIPKLGIKLFTAIATLSSIFSPLGIVLFGVNGAIAGFFLGFLGSAATVGVTASLVSEGEKSGIPQGQNCGERVSFLALVKVIGPLWYSSLYVHGKEVLGLSSLPFLFNTLLPILAFAIIQFNL